MANLCKILANIPFEDGKNNEGLANSHFLRLETAMLTGQAFDPFDPSALRDSRRQGRPAGTRSRAEDRAL